MREVKLGRRARPTEQVALPVRAARCAHEHKLGFGLYTLGDQVDAEAPPRRAPEHFDVEPMHHGGSATPLINHHLSNR